MQTPVTFFRILTYQSEENTEATDMGFPKDRKNKEEYPLEGLRDESFLSDQRGLSLGLP